MKVCVRAACTRVCVCVRASQRERRGEAEHQLARRRQLGVARRDYCLEGLAQIRAHNQKLRVRRQLAADRVKHAAAQVRASSCPLDGVAMVSVGQPHHGCRGVVVSSAPAPPGGLSERHKSVVCGDQAR
jgi:hypothetical protein